MKYVSLEDSVSLIKSGHHVFVQGSGATPLSLLRGLEGRAHELKNVVIYNLSTFGEMPIENEKYADSFFFNSLFVSNNVRKAVNSSRGSYIPVFLSEIHLLFEKGIVKPDVALIHVSPPDKHGFCSLGVSVDVARSAIKHAKCVIAQVNPNMPRTHGDGIIHISEINAMVETNDALPVVDYSSRVGDEERIIGKYCAELIEDGSTLQMGIGGIPDAVLQALTNHKDLGIHTEMFSDGILPLIESGVINNKCKKKHRGKVVTAFAAGSRKLYDFVDDNPLFNFLEASYVNDGAIIRKNPKVVAINSAIEIDLVGQVCADSIGSHQHSGVGGQMDFIRGASLSSGGKPIIALRSTTNKGASKIVPFLRQGASVVTTRAHVHFVITEFGVAYLFGKNLRQRAEALRDIAHPSHREELDKAIFERFGRQSFNF
jgi:acyl-CoA hydrolase